MWISGKNFDVRPIIVKINGPHPMMLPFLVRSGAHLVSSEESGFGRLLYIAIPDEICVGFFTRFLDDILPAALLLQKIADRWMVYDTVNKAKFELIGVSATMLDGFPRSTAPPENSSNFKLYVEIRNPVFPEIRLPVGPVS